MNIKDVTGLKGFLEIFLTDKNGKILNRVKAPNTITYLARNILQDLVGQSNLALNPNPIENQLWSLRVGTNSTEASRSDTGLGASPPGDIHGVTFSQPVTTGVSGELIITAEIEASDTAIDGQTLREAGLFTRGTQDALSFPATHGERMFSRQAHGPITKQVGVGIQYVWTLVFT